MNENTLPKLPYAAWKDTLDTLHMWAQIVGKVKLEFAPFANQWWEVAFYLTATGMTTGPIPYNSTAFSIDFDFLNHNLSAKTSTGRLISIPLKSRSVAGFYAEFTRMLDNLGIPAAIWPVPVEVPSPIPFEEDTVHRAYNPVWANRWWQVMLESKFIFDRFRSSFRGKNSPHHFFWGTFDLSGARFSGRPADPPEAEGVLKRIMKYAENEENFAYGFWPGDERYRSPAFYVYMHPEPPGFEAINVGEQASYNESLGEFVYPYELLRASPAPDSTLLNFLDTLYQGGARLASWDIQSLEAHIPPRQS